MAKDDGKIYITISDTRGGTGGPGTNPNISPDGRKEKEDNKNLLADYAKHKFFNLIQSQAKQAVNYSIANIGNFTGDYLQQEQVNFAAQCITDVVDIANAAWAGAKLTGSPWGALISAGVATVGKTYNYGMQIYAGYMENVRQNKQIAQLRTRAGLNSINNGSRGTEY